MPVHKRKNPSGAVVWYYQFNAPGSTRENRTEIRESGFTTKQAAIDAEAGRRIEEQQKYELAKAGSGVAAAPPKTLGMLLEEFLQQHAEERLAATTIHGYREKAAYLDPQLLAMPLADITPLHLNREWTTHAPSSCADRSGTDSSHSAQRGVGRRSGGRHGSAWRSTRRP